MKLKSNRAAGWTLVEIMIAVSLIGTLAAIAVPSFIKARDSSTLSTIRSNVGSIDKVKQQWALERRLAGSVVPTESDIQVYFKGGIMLSPVIGEVYNINALDQPASASIPYSLAGLAAGATIFGE